MNSFWQTYPFFRYTLALLAGIVWFTYPLPTIWQPYAWLLGFSAIYLLLWLLPGMWQRKNSFVWALLQLPMMFLVGYLLTIYGTPTERADHFYHSHAASEAYQALVSEEPQPKATGWSVVVTATATRIDGHWQQVTGKIQLFMAYDSTGQTPDPVYGQMLLISGSPNKYGPPKNPKAFDYGQYQQKQQIYLQQYLRPGQYRTVGQQPENGLFGLSIQARRYLQAVFEQYLGLGRESAIAKALVIGVKSGLDNEIKEAYAGAGAMHVLAVSGLHVGIVLLLLNGLIGRWRRGKALYRMVYVALAVSILWGYAFITGLSPSVVRAVSMFTVFAIAGGLRRHTNVYNNLLIACFCMLCYNPYYIFQVGFQLSYLAVFGIVFLQPKIAGWWQPKNKILLFIWEMTSVSIAAQIATFPLSLLYFQQFPTYFFLSNLVVVLAAWGIIGLGITLIFLASVGLYFGLPSVAAPIGDALWWVVHATNAFVYSFDQLPHSVLRNIYIQPYEMAAIYGLLIALIAWLIYKQKSFAYLGLALLFMLMGGRFWWIDQAYRQQWVGVFHARGYAHTFFVHQRQAWLFTNEDPIEAPDRMAYHSEGFFNSIGVEEVHWVGIGKSAGDSSVAIPLFQTSEEALWQLGNRRIYMLQKGNLPQSLKADIILLEGNARADSTALANTPAGIHFLLGNSLSYYQRNKWAEQLLTQNRPFTDINADGAFVERLR